jgi:type IV pilus assembly protein PilB
MGVDIVDVIVNSEKNTVEFVTLDPDNHQLDIEQVRIDPACTLKIPANIALRRKALPFLEMDGVLHIACFNVKNTSMAYTLERMVKIPVCFWEVEPDKLDKVLQKVYGNAATAALPALGGKPAETGSDAVSLSDKLLYAAYIRQASDIHIDPIHQGARIRFRVDGELEVYELIKTETYTELASRLKVMAGLDISEKRAPQDGRFSHQFVSGGKRIDMRVATLPTKYGERITMRLLAVQTDSLTLDRLGFTTQHQAMIEQFLRRTQGLMIMTGPTGSGKTTTLYAAIRMLLTERHVNIITVEDPIEYEMEGVAQVEIDPTSEKVSFAKALRSILRHDPDVVMLGEIRDRETADIAIKAALTGHMVLGTLHTNSAAATITRLIDMGVDSYLIAAALRLAVAQRLLKRLCNHCKVPRYLTEVEAIAIHRPELAGRQIYEPCGCVYCGNKGYAGRIGLYEILEMNAQWARDVADNKGEAVLEEKMRNAGVLSLLEDAIIKLLNGDTSLSEVIQIASSW